MDVNYDLYKTFYIVANCSTITEASKKLMISQPAVTKAIKNLEWQLNGNLFIRSKNGIKLTENGKKFYNYIKPAIEQMQDATKLFNNISKIELVKKQLLPLNKELLEKKEENTYKEDFVVEGNINDILVNIVTLYLLYEINIAIENSYASENIERQMLTKKSLDKIEEIEQEKKQEERKERKIKSFKKLLDSIIKTNKMEA